MAITALANFVFTDESKNDWTENLYLQGADINACRTSALAIANLRIGLLQPGNRMIEARVSDVAVFRDSLIVEQDVLLNGGEGNYPQVVAVPPEPDKAGEPAYVRLLCRMEAGSLYRRPYWLGGLPEDIVDQQGLYTPDRTWANRFAKWQLAVETLGFLRRKKGATVPGPDGGQILQRFNISGILTPDPSTMAPLSLRIQIPYPPAAIPLTVGTQLRIGQSKGTRNLNGLWRINNITAAVVAGNPGSSIGLDARRAPVEVAVDATQVRYGNVIAVNNGFASPFVAITSVIAERGVRRKTGGPFSRSPGRVTTQR